MKEAHDLAHEILGAHKEQMNLMAKVLLERETVEGEACQALLDGKWDEYLLREGDIIAAKEREEAEARAADERKLAAEAAVQPAGALGDANADNPYANPYGVSGYAQTYGSGAQPAKPVELTPASGDAASADQTDTSHEDNSADGK